MNSEDVTLIDKLSKKYNLDKKQGFTKTDVFEINLFKISTDEQMFPLLFNKGFVFLGRGKKIACINNELIENTPQKYGIIASPQPIECETCVLKEDSVIGLYIDLDMQRLHKIVSKYNEIIGYNFLDKKILRSVSIEEKTPAIDDVLSRILKAMQNELDSYMLISSLLDELYLRILQDSSGYILQQICEQSSSFSRIIKVIEYIHNNYEKKMYLEDMAQMANMSINNFHRLFKKATSDTPVQFIKKIRLGRARELILHKKMKAIDASQKVGYDSSTQFSREFKRYFGVTPSKIGELGYMSF